MPELLRPLRRAIGGDEFRYLRRAASAWLLPTGECRATYEDKDIFAGGDCKGSFGAPGEAVDGVW